MKKGIIIVFLFLFIQSFIFPSVITVTEPKENSIWYEGQTMKIVWKTEGEPKLGVKIHLSYYFNGSFRSYWINKSPRGISPSGTISWKIPLNLFSASYKQNKLERRRKAYIVVRTWNNIYGGKSKGFIIKPLTLKVPKKN